jgi:tetratricopeptide (TPR) repeat protein
MELEAYLARIEQLWPPAGQAPSKEAVAVCLEATENYPNSSQLWCALGIIMQRCGPEFGFNPDGFLGCCENAVKADRRNFEAYQELGFVLDVYFDRFNEAQKAFESAIELGGGVESYYGLARVLAESGRVGDAIAGLSKDVCPYYDDPMIRELRSEIEDGSWHRSPRPGENRV